MIRYKIISPCKERDMEGNPLRKFALGEIVTIKSSEAKRLLKAGCLEPFSEVEDMTIEPPENRMRRGRKKKYGAHTDHSPDD